jgi:Concanavalin A-like lectin/glucanases superfamily
MNFLHPFVLTISFEICPPRLSGNAQQVLLARTGCFRVALEMSDKPAVTAQFRDTEGKTWSIRSNPITPEQWSSVVIEWNSDPRANLDDDTRLSVTVNGTDNTRASTGLASLASGKGPLTIGFDPPARSSSSYQGMIRAVQLSDGKTSFGDWPLDDGPGRWASDHSRLGLDGIAERTQSVVR